MKTFPWPFKNTTGLAPAPPAPGTVTKSLALRGPQGVVPAPPKGSAPRHPAFPSAVPRGDRAEGRGWERGLLRVHWQEDRPWDRPH